MAVKYEPGTGMTQQQVNAVNRRKEISYTSATDDQTLTNIGGSGAPTEIPGQGGTNILRPTVTTKDVVEQTYIELFGWLGFRNVTAGSAAGDFENFIVNVEYEKSSVPGTWNIVNEIRFGLLSAAGVQFNNWAQTPVVEILGVKDAQHGVILLPNTRYTFRLRIWCSTDANADVTLLSNTLGIPRRLWAIVHHF